MNLSLVVVVVVMCVGDTDRILVLWPAAAATDDGVDVALVFANDSRFSKHSLLGMRFAKVNRKENFNYSHSTKLSVYLLGVYILYYLSLFLW